MITELDAAIIAEEQGWEYLPACDEALLLLAEIEQVQAPELPKPTLPAPAPNPPQAVKPQHGVKWLKGGQTHMFFMYVNGAGNWWRVKIHTHNGSTYAQRIRPDATINKKTKWVRNPEKEILTLPGRHNHKAARQMIEEAGL
jgi:hypothetical protein